MKHTKWFWGVFFVLAAAFVVASQVTDFVQIGFWSILGTILLVALFVQSLIHRNFFGVFLPVALLYAIFCQPLGWPVISIWILLAAAVLAGTGFHFLFRSHPPYYAYTYHKDKDKHPHYQTIEENMDGDNTYAKVSFGSSTKYLHSDALKTGQFYCSFGSLEIYLDQAQLNPDGAQLYLDCSFGSIELYVPRAWQVKSNIQATLGAVNIEKNEAHISADAPVLTLTGNVSFGAIEVNYV